MYQFSYADIMADDTVTARARECEALGRAAMLLRRAVDGRPGAPAEVEALRFTIELWSMLIRDLAGPGNALPDALRAALMSIGLGIMAECERIGRGQSRDLAGIADICDIIGSGLK